MGHYIALCALTVIAAFGLFKLGQVFLSWVELGFAKEHDTIDRRGLHEWVERFGKKISLANAAAFLGLAIGAIGALYGMSYSAPVAIGAVACGSCIITAAAYAYRKLGDEFRRTVGLTVEIASAQVTGSLS